MPCRSGHALEVDFQRPIEHCVVHLDSIAVIEDDALIGEVGVKNIYSAKCLCGFIQQRCGGLVLGGVERGAYGLTTQAGDLLLNRGDPVYLPRRRCDDDGRNFRG